MKVGKILVIGGNGFIGKNLVDSLVKVGYEVGIYDLVYSERKDVKSYKGDILNDEQLEEILREYSKIVYLISAIMPQKSMDEPTSAYLTDIPLLIKVLEICKKIGGKQIIYSSSGGTIYGENEVANSERTCGNPDCHYGICKQTCENILLLYNKIFSMKNIILRISNPYGKYQNGKNGVGVITAMTIKAIKERKIDVWGDGENARDFVSIEDVVQGFIAAIKWNFEEGCIPIFNIGSGVPTKIKDIIAIICDEISDININYMPERPFDVKCNYLDISKAKKILGYRVSDAVGSSIRKHIRNLKNETMI